AAFELTEATRPDFTDAATRYSGNQRRFEGTGLRQEDYYYRVRAQVGGDWEAWPAAVGVRVMPFTPCDWKALPTPALDTGAGRVLVCPVFEANQGALWLAWAGPPVAVFQLEEGTRPDYGIAAVLYCGDQTRCEVRGRVQGDYYYRVLARLGDRWSGWSAGI